MNRIFSNGLSGDYVQNAFARLATTSLRLHLAAPYFTKPEDAVELAKEGKPVQLLVGLNTTTTPTALSAVLGVPNLSVRYLTGRRFHAKIYVFDSAALLGSANLTDGGFLANREAVICLDRPEDLDAVEDIRSLFLELWESARVLTDEILRKFKVAWEATKRAGPDPDAWIEEAVGKAEPPNIDVASRTRSRERLFIDALQRQVIQQYRPAFLEVMGVLEEFNLRRPELQNIGPANETNRFLNWVRLTHVIGDDAWRLASIRSQNQRRAEIVRTGQEWSTTDDNKIPNHYIDWLSTVRRVFGSKQSIESATKDELTDGLQSLHAFAEQLRFVKGGMENLPSVFWTANNNNLDKVKQTLTYLIHGTGDFVERLHDVLYDPSRKLGYFGRFCALELFGTVRPDQFPPINGRMAKALRYLGFDVRGN